MVVASVFYPDSGPGWLGHQGDPYDAQWDMVMALCGAVIAQAVFGRAHDRSMATVMAHREKLAIAYKTRR
jgi:putative membrane protein